MTMAGENVVLIGCYDITDRNRAINALRESAHNLAEAERIAHLGGWIWDMGANTLQWSDETYRIFGLEPQSIEMSYPTFLEHVHVDDRAEVEQAVNYALETRALRGSNIAWYCRRLDQICARTGIECVTPTASRMRGNLT